MELSLDAFTHVCVSVYVLYIISHIVCLIVEAKGIFKKIIFKVRCLLSNSHQDSLVIYV